MAKRSAIPRVSQVKLSLSHVMNAEIQSAMGMIALAG